MKRVFTVTVGAFLLVSLFPSASFGSSQPTFAQAKIIWTKCLQNPTAAKTPAVCKQAKQIVQSSTQIDFSMKQDILYAESGVLSLIHNWRGVPPKDIPVIFNSKSSTWSIISGSRTLASGKSHNKNIITGFIWTDGSSCLQASNPFGTGNQMMRSDQRLIVAGSCPKQALGDMGALPQVTTAPTPLPTATPLSQPGTVNDFKVVSTPGTAHSVRISWSLVQGATSYIITIIRGADIQVSAVSAPNSDFTINQLKDGNAVFSIRAVNIKGMSVANSRNVTLKNGVII